MSTTNESRAEAIPAESVYAVLEAKQGSGQGARRVRRQEGSFRPEAPSHERGNQARRRQAQCDHARADPGGHPDIPELVEGSFRKTAARRVGRRAWE
jgi:hypothetical protein